MEAIMKLTQTLIIASVSVIDDDDGVTQVEPDYDVIIEADHDGLNGVDETLFLTWAELAQ
jgi:hypothetical protein